MTPEQLAKLNAFANGTFECKVPSTPIVVDVRQQDTGCEQSCNVAPTQQTVLIDVANANQAQCGIMSLFIDMTSTTISAARQLTMGGCLRGGDETLGTEFFGFPTTAYIWGLDVANVIGGKSANFNPTLFDDWFQCQLENNNMVFSNITAENLGGATSLDAFNTFKAQSIRTATVNPWDSWGNCQTSRKKILCGPCTDNENIAQFTGLMAVSARAAVSINIPDNLNVVLDFCVTLHEGARNMTVCA